MASASELTQRRSDLAAIEDDVLTWNGTPYSGVFTEFIKTDSPEVGGYVVSYDASFYVRTALFSSTRPNKEDVVMISVGGQTKTFVVDRVHNYPDDVAMELELKSQGQ